VALPGLDRRAGGNPGEREKIKKVDVMEYAELGMGVIWRDRGGIFSCVCLSRR